MEQQGTVKGRDGPNGRAMLRVGIENSVPWGLGFHSDGANPIDEG